jgi:mRNA degradation ribonuclease J1/J2
MEESLPTTLIFYGGVSEIGGNKILLQDKDTKIFLDFGKGFSKREKFLKNISSLVWLTES